MDHRHTLNSETVSPLDSNLCDTPDTPDTLDILAEKRTAEKYTWHTGVYELPCAREAAEENFRGTRSAAQRTC